MIDCYKLKSLHMKPNYLISIWVVLFTSAISLFGQIQTANTSVVYDEVDQLPYIKNHRKSLHEYVDKKKVYPAELKIKGIEGDVIVSFVVDEAGKVQNAKIVEGSNPALNELALNVILKSGEWKPGKIKDIAVATRMKVPVVFRLNDDERRMMESLKSIDFENKPPLFVLDGKLVEAILKIEPYNIKSIRVIKGEKAIALYGERAKNGVVEITSKRGTPPVY
jgi:TonB family protein